MKAFLLAAGRGTRLAPLTNNIPKCLVPIKGEPLLGIWLKLCKLYGITDVLVNLHHLSGLVEDYLRKQSFGINVTAFYEKNLLGSAGTILANRDFVKQERSFFIIYVDNLTNINLTKMAAFHIKYNSSFTIGVFKTAQPRACGIVELDKSGIVSSFEEKPDKPKSDLANAGIYISGNEIFSYIPRKQFADFGIDVLPHLVGKMHGYKIKEYYLDIGDPGNYEKANKEWETV